MADTKTGRCVMTTAVAEPVEAGLVFHDRRRIDDSLAAMLEEPDPVLEETRARFWMYAISRVRALPARGGRSKARPEQWYALPCWGSADDEPEQLPNGESVDFTRPLVADSRVQLMWLMNALLDACHGLNPTVGQQTSAPTAEPVELAAAHPPTEPIPTLRPGSEAGRERGSGQFLPVPNSSGSGRPSPPY